MNKNQRFLFTLTASVFIGLLVLAIFTAVVKASRRSTPAKPKLSAEQVELNQIRAEIEALRGELQAARAEVPKGQNVIFWWENREGVTWANAQEKGTHQFGLREDGVIVWKYK